MENDFLRNAVEGRGSSNNGYTGTGPRNPIAFNAFTSLWATVGPKEMGYQGMTQHNNGSVTLRFHGNSHLMRKINNIQGNQLTTIKQNVLNGTWHVTIPKNYADKLPLPKKDVNNNKGESKWNSITNSIPPLYKNVFRKTMALVYAQHIKGLPKKEQQALLESIRRLLPGMMEYFHKLLDKPSAKKKR